MGHKFSIVGNVFSTGTHLKKKQSGIGADNLKEPNSGDQANSNEQKESIAQELKAKGSLSSRPNSPFLGGLMNLNNSIGGSSNIHPVIKS
jgi:hypothetical protein